MPTSLAMAVLVDFWARIEVIKVSDNILSREKVSLGLQYVVFFGFRREFRVQVRGKNNRSEISAIVIESKVLILESDRALGDLAVLEERWTVFGEVLKFYFSARLAISVKALRKTSAASWPLRLLLSFFLFFFSTIRSIYLLST